MAAVEIDIASAAHRHNEIIDRPNAVHLFSDVWLVRRWATAWVAEQKTTTPAHPIFKNLESISFEGLASWLTGGDPGVHPTRPSFIGQAVRVGIVSKSDFDSPQHLAEPVKRLAATYAGMSADFAVPYLEVTD